MSKDHRHKLNFGCQHKPGLRIVTLTSKKSGTPEFHKKHCLCNCHTEVSLKHSPEALEVLQSTSTVRNGYGVI